MRATSRDESQRFFLGQKKLFRMRYLDLSFFEGSLPNPYFPATNIDNPVVGSKEGEQSDGRGKRIIVGLTWQVKARALDI